MPLSLVEQRARRADRREARPARPSRSTSTTGASCSTASATPTTRSRSRVVGKYIEAPRRLQVGLRIARPRRHRPPAPACVVRESRPRRSSARAPSASSAASTASSSPAASAMRGIEGKIEAIRYARERRHPVLRHLPGHAVRGDRVRPQRARPGRRQQHRVRQAHAAPGDLPAGRAARRSPTRAARCGSAPSPARWPPDSLARAGLRRRRDQRAAPAPLRVQQRLPPAVRGTTASSSTGTSPDGQLVEIVELPDHPWFLAVQFHPEFKSKPTKAHPLFRDFVAAALRPPRGGPGRAGSALSRRWAYRRINAAMTGSRAISETGRWVRLDDPGGDDRRGRPGRRAPPRSADVGRVDRPRVLGHPDSTAAGGSRSPTRR